MPHSTISNPLTAHNKYKDESLDWSEQFIATMYQQIYYEDINKKFVSRKIWKEPGLFLPLGMKNRGELENTPRVAAGICCRFSEKYFCTNHIEIYCYWTHAKQLKVWFA
jgi:hypothetical protein